MNKIQQLTMILIATTTAAHAVSPGVYEYSSEATEALRYAAQVRAQARDMDALADSAEKFNRENARALRQAQRQQSAYVRMVQGEEQLAKAKVYIAEYPHVEYDIHSGAKDVKAVIK